MNGTIAWVPWKTVESFIYDTFRKLDVPEEDARICTDVILESDRRGIESHGCNRFKPMYVDRIVKGLQTPRTELEVLKETPTTLVVDAQQGLGMVASYRVMKRLIAKAKTVGLAMGAVKNSSHFGIAGYWSTMASKEGLIGITGTNTRPSQAPTFGVQNILGTNPLAFAFPTDEPFPFLFDGATCVHSKGWIEYYHRLGEEVPEGLVVGRDGKCQHDSGAILKGFKTNQSALLPLGGAGEEQAGYKGYDFACVVEILCSALAGGDFLTMLSGVTPDGRRVHHNVGHFFLVINPDFFMGEDIFRKTAGAIVRQLRASEKAPGAERIYTAGEKAYETWQYRKNKGVPLTPGVQQEFIEVRDRYHIDCTFPFEKK